MASNTTIIALTHLQQPRSSSPTPDEEHADMPRDESQPQLSSKPDVFSSLLAEFAFVGTCTMGQLFFAMHLSHIFVNQVTLLDTLQVSASLTPWFIGSFLVANGVSVVVSGSLADLVSPRRMAIASFAWLCVWNIIGAFSVTPQRAVLFFVVRAMSGCAVGSLCSTAMSMLGRVYRPGVRKNQVFAAMGAMIPLGFAIGALQGGALSAHLEWIYGSTAIISAGCVLLAQWCIPDLPTSDSVKRFDVAGAATGVVGCGLIIFGLTQGAPTRWTPYTYALVLVGLACLFVFGLIEGRVERPLIKNRLWSTPAFIPLMIAYFLGYGGYCGGWQFYAVRFLLANQEKSPIVTACCLLPVGVAGVLASWTVGRLLHIFPGHYILCTSMIAFASGPVFFLPQSENTLYWRLSFPGFIISTFGPDMSFAAISVYITSSVPKTYQGAAGSLLLTTQNLSTAVMAAIGDTIGDRITAAGPFEMDMPALRAIWWFSFTSCILGAAICVIFVRISKSEEKEHVT